MTGQVGAAVVGRMVWACREPVSALIALTIAALAPSPLARLAAVTLATAAAALTWHHAPHLAERTRRLRVRVRAARVLARTGLYTDDAEAYRSLRVRPGAQHPGVYTVTARIPAGKRDADLHSTADALAVHLRAHAVYPHLVGPRDGRARCLVVLTDPLRHPIPPPTTQPARPGWLTVPLGLDPTGHQVTLDLVRPRRGGQHVLICGTTGSGKNSAVRRVIESARTHDTTLLLIDPKATEMARYRDDAAAYAVAATDAVDLLAGAVDLMRERQSRLADDGRSVWDLERDGPACLVVVDELSVLTSACTDRRLRAEAEAHLHDLAARGRSVALGLLLVSQSPLADTIPSAIRSLVGYRLALAVADPSTAEIALPGVTTIAPVLSPHRIRDTPGLGTLSGPSVPDGYVRLRIYHDEDE